MADKLLIIMVNSDPANPSELSSPLFQAAVAAAMEYEVEVILTGRSGELAAKGVAEKIKVQNSGTTKTVYEIIRDTCSRKSGCVAKRMRREVNSKSVRLP